MTAHTVFQLKILGPLKVSDFAISQYLADIGVSIRLFAIVVISLSIYMYPVYRKHTVSSHTIKGVIKSM